MRSGVVGLERLTCLRVRAERDAVRVRTVEQILSCLAPIVDAGGGVSKRAQLANVSVVA